MNEPTKTKNNSRLVSFLTFILSALIVVGCTIQGKDKGEAPPPVAAPGVPVDGLVVKPRLLEEELVVAGSLVANQEVDIASELMRKIVYVHVKEGNFVSEGTLLFQLDDAELQAQLEQVQQREKLAALNEDRLRDLIAHDAAIQQDYDQAVTNLKVLQAEIRQLNVTISKTRIRAPFDGRIGIIRAYPGALVSPNTVLTNIVDDGQIKVEFSVPEKYAKLIPIGSVQSFTVESDTREFSARVISRESHLNETTRTLLIRAITTNPGRILLPGQSARLKLSVHSDSDALMVSSQALMPSSQGYSVFVAKSNQVVLTPVEIGQRDPYDVQIIKGLTAGDTVVTSNLLRLVPGTRVAFASIK